jgi:hypothetical protein
LFNGKQKPPVLKSNESWDDWKDAFSSDNDTLINVPPRKEPAPKPAPKLIVPDLKPQRKSIFSNFHLRKPASEKKPAFSPEVVQFFEDPDDVTYEVTDAHTTTEVIK